MLLFGVGIGIGIGIDLNTGQKDQALDPDGLRKNWSRFA